MNMNQNGIACYTKLIANDNDGYKLYASQLFILYKIKRVNVVQLGGFIHYWMFVQLKEAVGKKWSLYIDSNFSSLASGSVYYMSFIQLLT